MKKLLSVQLFANEVLAHVLNDKDVKETLVLSEVRGAVAMPTPTAPGYFIFLGKQRSRNEFGKHPLHFLAEGEDPALHSLFEKLSDVAVKVECRIVYAVQKREKRDIGGPWRELWNFIHEKRLNLQLIPAPSANDIDYGKVLIGEALKTKALILPRTAPTIIKAQLQRMVPDSDGDEFYAFNALRFLLAGFSKYKSELPFVEQRVKDRKSAGGWT